MPGGFSPSDPRVQPSKEQWVIALDTRPSSYGRSCRYRSVLAGHWNWLSIGRLRSFGKQKNRPDRPGTSSILRNPATLATEGTRQVRLDEFRATSRLPHAPERHLAYKVTGLPSERLSNSNKNVELTNRRATQMHSPDGGPARVTNHRIRYW